MKAIIMLVMGITAGALFMNAKYETHTHHAQEQVILGHRIGPDGQEMLVVR